MSEMICVSASVYRNALIRGKQYTVQRRNRMDNRTRLIEQNLSMR